jgi:signal transduction histidine kinase
LDAGDTHELIGRLARNARDLDGLIGDLLDLDQLQRNVLVPEMRVVELLNLVGAAVGRSEVSGAIVVAGERVFHRVDPDMVERMLDHLIENAHRHNPIGTKIWVKVEKREGGPTITVSDDGPGVPPSLRALMFQPFTRGPTATPHDPGVGIGLALVQRFAELHSARAWIEPRDGGGNEVKIAFGFGGSRP